MKKNYLSLKTFLPVFGYWSGNSFYYEIFKLLCKSVNLLHKWKHLWLLLGCIVKISAFSTVAGVPTEQSDLHGKFY